MITLSDQTGFNFLTSVIEPLRKRYRFGMWSPGQAVTKDKIVFSYFTHNSKEYIREFLELLGCKDPKIIAKFPTEFSNPDICKREQVYFNSLKESCSKENILKSLNNLESEASKIQYLFENFIISSKNSPDFQKSITEFATQCFKRKLFSPITILIKDGLDLSHSADNQPSLLTLLCDYLSEKDAIELLQFTLRSYVNENKHDLVISIVNVCKSHNINVDEPGRPSGKTTLHWASIKGYTDLRELLISSGADPSKKDASGKTPDMYFEDHKEQELGLK